MTKASSALSSNRLVEYLSDTRAELRKVVWPTREQAVNLTGVVLLITFVMTVLLGGVDYIFGQLLAAVIGYGS